MLKPEESIQVLKGDFTNIKLLNTESHSDIFAQAFEMSIKALEMRCRKLIKKNMCPYCGKLMSIHTNFCPDCGQALDWKGGEQHE